MKHTPGPWRLLIEVNDDFILRTVLGWDPQQPRNLSEVALMTTGSYPDEVEAANARLVASAPELLEALQIMELAALCLADSIHAGKPEVIATAQNDVHNAHMRAEEVIKKSLGA